MSSTRVSIHVRGAKRATVIAQIERRMARRGLERVEYPSRSEPLLVRVRLVERGTWISLSIEDLETADEWARVLARELRVPVLGAWFWDGEASLTLTLFEGAGAPAKLSLPGDARRASDGRVTIPLGDLSPLVPRAKPTKAPLDILVRAEDASFDEDERCVYLPADDVERALQRAFAIEELFVDPLLDDVAEELLHFRPKPSSAMAKRERAAREAEHQARQADCDGRLYTVGWLAFDVEMADLERLLETTARAIIDMVGPHLGSRQPRARAIVVGKEATELPPPANGDGAWKAYARSLREGKMIDLGRREAPMLAAVWLIVRDGALVVGWCMRGLKDPSKRKALATAMANVFDASTNDPRCFGALITSQQSPMSLDRQVLAFEYLRATSVLALRPAAHRTRARAPGWRVLVPRAAPDIDGQPPLGVTARRTKAGIVIEADGADPHEMTAEAMAGLETYLGQRLPNADDARAQEGS